MISIIVPWKNRDEIYRACPTFVSVVEELGGELILVNYGGAIKPSLLPSSSAIRVLDVQGRSQFNKCIANNIGASAARHKMLFFCDCDIVLDIKTISRCVNLVEPSKSFATIKNVKEEICNSIASKHLRRFGYRLTIETVSGAHVEIIDFEEDSDNGLRNAPGLLFVSMADFTAIDGYAGYLQGWGWEDQDIICRLTLGLGLKRYQDGMLEHISHSDTVRMQEYPDAVNRWESRDRMFRKALARYDQGHFFGTMSVDLEEYTNRANDQ